MYTSEVRKQESGRFEEVRRIHNRDTTRDPHNPNKYLLMFYEDQGGTPSVPLKYLL